MTKSVKIVLPLGVLLVGLATAVAIVKARPAVDRQEAAALPPLVRVMQTRPQDLALTVHSQGTVAPRVESILVAQVAGQIDWVSPAFAEGGFFDSGDKLVQIDSRDYELVVSQAEAQVAQAKVRLELEQAEAELAREEWQDLGSGDGSPLALREPQLAEARAAVLAAEAALEKARLDLERTSIRSRFDGRIRTKLVDLGQFVNRGASLATVYSIDTAELRLPVKKEDFVFLGLEPSLRLDDGGAASREVVLRARIGRSDYAWRGRIVRSGSELDANTRMLPLFAQVQDPLRRLPGAEGAPLPMGIFVDAEIAGIELQGVFVLPRSALRDGDQVLVVDGEDRLRLRDVEVIRAQRDEIIVDAGLAADELVCISQIETVVDGMKVRTVLEESPLVTDAQREAHL